MMTFFGALCASQTAVMTDCVNSVAVVTINNCHDGCTTNNWETHYVKHIHC